VQTSRHSGIAGLVAVALVFSGMTGAVVGLSTSVSSRQPETVVAPADGAAKVASAGLKKSSKPAVKPKAVAKPAIKPKAKPVIKAKSKATLKTASVVDTQWADDDGSACPAPRWPTTLSTGSPGNGRRVLVIGDSRTRDSRIPLIDGLVASGWTPTVRCWGWKTIPWGTAQVRRARSLHQLPNVVVISLGINDMKEVSPETTRRRMDELLDAIGPDHKVLWVEEYSTRSPKTFSNSHLDYAPRVKAFNTNLNQLRSKYPNLSVIPWASVVKENKLGLFDGIHYGKRGYQYRAQAVVDGVNSIAG